MIGGAGCAERANWIMIEYKPVAVTFAQTAEYGIESIPVPDSFAQSVVPKSFSDRISDPARDVSDGSVRFRHFGYWVVTYQITELAEHVSVLILDIAMPNETSFAADILDRLDRVGRAILPGYAAFREAMTPRESGQ